MESFKAASHVGQVVVGEGVKQARVPARAISVRPKFCILVENILGELPT